MARPLPLHGLGPVLQSATVSLLFSIYCLVSVLSTYVMTRSETDETINVFPVSVFLCFNILSHFIILVNLVLVYHFLYFIKTICLLFANKRVNHSLTSGHNSRHLFGANDAGEFPAVVVLGAGQSSTADCDEEDECLALIVRSRRHFGLPVNADVVGAVTQRRRHREGFLGHEEAGVLVGPAGGTAGTRRHHQRSRSLSYVADSTRRRPVVVRRTAVSAVVVLDTYIHTTDRFTHKEA